MSNQQLAVRDNNAQISTRYNEADIQAEMGILRAAFPKLDAPPEGLRARRHCQVCRSGVCTCRNVSRVDLRR